MKRAYQNLMQLSDFKMVHELLLTGEAIAFLYKKTNISFI